MTKSEKEIIKGIAEAVDDYECGEYAYYAIVADIANASGIKCDEVDVMGVLCEPLPEGTDVEDLPSGVYVRGEE